MLKKTLLAVAAMASFTAAAGDLRFKQEIVNEEPVVTALTLRPDINQTMSQLTLECKDGVVEQGIVVTDIDMFSLEEGTGTLTLFIDGEERPVQALVSPNVYMAEAKVDLWVNDDMTAHTANKKASNAWLINNLLEAQQQVSWEISYQGVTTELSVVNVGEYYQSVITNFASNCEK